MRERELHAGDTTGLMERELGRGMHPLGVLACSSSLPQGHGALGPQGLIVTSYQLLRMRNSQGHGYVREQAASVHREYEPPWLI